MKRVGHIFEQVVEWQNCLAAVLEESRTKRLRRSGRGEELRAHAEEWAAKVHARLMAGAFTPGPMVEFDIVEGGKDRHISMHNLFDSICIRAVVRVLEPIIYARMTPHSHCPVKGRGPLRLARHLQHTLRKMEYENRQWMALHPKQKRYIWVLKCDIRKYFPSIRQDVAIAALRRWIKDERVINICASLLDKSVGIPIGAAYSAMIANCVHLELDWHMASFLKVLSYDRYMDDTVMLFRSKEAAHAAREEYERELNKLGLTCARKWQVFRADRRPITLGGFKIRSHSIHISGRISRHLLRLIDDAHKHGWQNMSSSEWRAAASLYGWIASTDSFNFKNKWRKANGNEVFRLIGLAERTVAGRPLSRQRDSKTEPSGDTRCGVYRLAA